MALASPASAGPIVPGSGPALRADHALSSADQQIWAAAITLSARDGWWTLGAYPVDWFTANVSAISFNDSSHDGWGVAARVVWSHAAGKWPSRVRQLPLPDRGWLSGRDEPRGTPAGAADTPDVPVSKIPEPSTLLLFGLCLPAAVMLGSARARSIPRATR
jgi:hypothetical protein